MEQSILEYKCPCCGGKIEFDSKTQKMKCPYCDSEFDTEALKQYDEALNGSNSDDMQWETSAGGQWQEGETDGMRTYTCKSCGGEIIGDENMAATNCPYCDNPVVMTGQFKGDLKPDYVIPFKLDTEAAKNAMKQHFEGKKLLPKVFKDENHLDEIKGLYVPFWLFDADATAQFLFKAVKERHYDRGEYEYTEYNYYSVARHGDISFDNVPVDGSSKMPDDLMESVEPYNFDEAKDFQTAFLAGYLADKYDVDDKQSVDRANERIKASTENEFKKTAIGYDSINTESANIQLQNGKAKYALYPVWLLNTSWNGQKFTFAMNGQTGKFVGNLPMDKGAFWRWLIGLFVGIGAVGTALLCVITGNMESLGKQALVCFGLGLIISLIVTFSWKAQLSSVHMQSGAGSYIRKNSFKVNYQKDTFLYKKVDKRKKN